MTSRRTICQEAHELLLARQDHDGDLTNTWRRIAEEVRFDRRICVSAASSQGPRALLRMAAANSTPVPTTIAPTPIARIVRR